MNSAAGLWSSCRRASDRCAPHRELHRRVRRRGRSAPQPQRGERKWGRRPLQQPAVPCRRAPLPRPDCRRTRRAHSHHRSDAPHVHEVREHIRRVRPPPRGGLMYLLDANAFMEANRLYYAFDIAPGFWTWLGDPTRVGQVASIDAVKDEITAGTGDLVDWARARPDSFWLAD